MKKKMAKRQILTRTLSLTMAAGLLLGTTQVYARSSQRAAWNDASSDKSAGTTVSDSLSVETGESSAEYTAYSNVYADSDAWAAWKTLWADEIRDNYEQVALTPGADETQLNFAWYSYTKETPMVRMIYADGTTKVFDGTQDTDNAESFTITDDDGNKTTVVLYPNKVTVTGLEEETDYQYEYYVDGAWSEKYDYSTESFSSFSVMYVGDPQIGASTGQTTADGTSSNDNGKEYYAMNDAYNWNQTLLNATEQFSDLAFILSAGDQINQTSVSSDANKLQQQIEYAGFLYPSVLRSLPIATTIGNHDSASINYSNHFNNPNTQTTEETTAGATTAGTDYYFVYGNTLFISIDTNNYNCATHENVIKEAVEAYPDATWRILMFHQDIYGSGYDHSDSDGMVLRTQLTPIIDEYDIDAVLQGHDHTYSRTYQLSSTTSIENAVAYSTYTTDADSDYQSDNASCYNILTGLTNLYRVVDPEGTVYFEANSSTGSKYYQMIGTQQDYIAARSQSWRPTYAVIDITETTLTVTTYDAATGEVLVADGDIESTYTIVKQADKTSLESAIAEAQDAYDAAAAEGTYTEESLKTLEDTIAAAQAIYEDEEADSTDIASAITSLQDAQSALALVDTDSDDTDSDDTDSNSDDTDNTAASSTASAVSSTSSTSDAAVASAYYNGSSVTAAAAISLEEEAVYDEENDVTAVVTDTSELEEGVTYVVVIDGEAYEAYVEDGVLYISGDVTGYDLDGLTIYEKVDDSDSDDTDDADDEDDSSSVTSKKMGDTSLIWMLLGYAVAGISACGLAVLRFKKFNR